MKTAADDKFCDMFYDIQGKQYLTFCVGCLPAESQGNTCIRLYLGQSLLPPIFFVLKVLPAFYISYIYSNALQTTFDHGCKHCEL